MPPWARRIWSSLRPTSNTSSGTPTIRWGLFHLQRPSRRGRRIRLHHQRPPSTLRPPSLCRATTTTRTWTAISSSPAKRKPARILRPMKTKRTGWTSIFPSRQPPTEDGMSPSSGRHPKKASSTSVHQGLGSPLPRRMAHSHLQFEKSPSSATTAAPVSPVDGST